MGEGRGEKAVQLSGRGEKRKQIPAPKRSVKTLLSRLPHRGGILDLSNNRKTGEERE